MSTSTIVSVPPEEAYRMARDGALLVDVREPLEYQSGHASDAHLLPLGALVAGRDDLPRDRRVLLICATGNRSSHAARVLQQRGVDVIDVAGGMAAWRSAGLPTQR